jgi:hypothetical protein
LGHFNCNSSSRFEMWASTSTLEMRNQQLYISYHANRPGVGRWPLEMPKSLPGDINTTDPWTCSCYKIYTWSIHHLRRIPKSRFHFIEHVYIGTGLWTCIQSVGIRVPVRLLSILTEILVGLPGHSKYVLHSEYNHLLMNHYIPILAVYYHPSCLIWQYITFVVETTSLCNINT